MSNPVQDQWNAAIEDARRRLHEVEGTADVVAVNLHADSDQGPHERLLAHVLSHYIGGDEFNGAMSAAPGCPHVGTAPAVVFGAAAFPAMVFCGDCFQRVWKVYENAWRSMGCFTPCDNCHGKPVPGTVDGSSTGVVNFGPIMLTISLCAECTRLRESGD